MNGFGSLVKWFMKPFLSLCILELGLMFTPIPDWWEAGVFDHYLCSTRVMNWVGWFFFDEYNSLGYRDSEWEKGGKKVAFLGDSRTFGLFVNERQTYASQIENLSDWEGMNLGIPGATTFEALDSMLPDALEFSPQAVVLCLDLNSSLISFITREDSGHRADWGRHFIRSSNTWRFIEGALHSAFSERQPVIIQKDYRDQLTDIFRTIELNNIDKKVLIVGWTPLKDFPNLYTQTRYDLYRDISREVALQHNAQIIDQKQLLDDLSLSEAYVGEHQIHLSALAHKKMAAAVLKKLNAED